MVLRRGYIYGMEVQFDRTLVVDPRKTCALLFHVSSQILMASPRTNIVGSGKSVLWSVVTCHVLPLGTYTAN